VNDLVFIKKSMNSAGFVILQHGGEFVQRIPKTMVRLDDETWGTVSAMLDELEQLDDVQNVFHNSASSATNKPSNES